MEWKIMQTHTHIHTREHTESSGKCKHCRCTLCGSLFAQQCEQSEESCGRTAMHSHAQQSGT